MLQDPSWVKTAFNANFERVCLNKYFNINIPPEQWDCTMVRASLLTLPLSLDSCSKVLGAPLKDKQGKALIKLFSEKMASPQDAPRQVGSLQAVLPAGRRVRARHSAEAEVLPHT
jgi:hypothetical protein